MNTTTKILAFFVAAALLIVACNGAPADDTDPSISELRVNGVASSAGEGEHQLGTIAQFTMNLSDNRGLEEFQAQVEGTLDYIKQLEGTTTAIEYDFTIDADTYSVSDTIQINFIVEDEGGNQSLLPYFIWIVE